MHMTYECPYCGFVDCRCPDEPEGTEGQDRSNYTDTQDRESYVPDPVLEENDD